MTPHAVFRDLTLADGVARGVVRPEHARHLCEGHFPGDPLLPGASLAGLMADLAEWLVLVIEARRAVTSELVRCVFLARARPDDEIRVSARVEGPERVTADVYAGETCAARATLRLDRVP